MRRAFLRSALFPVALLSIVGPALALDHVLENVTIKGGADGSELAIPRMEITETNLTRAEINKLLSLDASADEANALAGRLQAKRISIPQMTLIARGDDTGTIVISNQLVVNIDKGRFERISIDGIEGKFMMLLLINGKKDFGV